MKIEDKNQQISDEDDDDIESLRLAALQTLRKAPAVQPAGAPLYSQSFPNPPGAHRRFQSKGANRTVGKSNFPNGRNRVSTLVAITPLGEDGTVVAENSSETSTAPKLVLPQDRYFNQSAVLDDPKVKTSKFNRYDNSDQESDSDGDESVLLQSDTESTGKLERASSLDALMQELEKEISGETKPKCKTKVKKTQSECKEKYDVEKVTDKVEAENIVQTQKEPDTKVVQISEKVDTKILKQEIKKPDDQIDQVVQHLNSPQRYASVKRRPSKEFQQRGNFLPQNIPTYNDPPVNYDRPPFQPEQYSNIPYPPPRYPHDPPYQANHHITEQPQFPTAFQPVSPLHINAEGLSTIAMAPLSPRSAAFVLHNREIIERRKKSPRYSRSPSPYFRRSRTPSPRRYPRSPSPKRVSPPRRRVPSRMNSPLLRLSPPRKSPPPLRKSPPLPQRSPPKSQATPPKASIRERLGNKVQKPDEVKRKRTPSPEVPKKQVKEDKAVDPVLEARKRKFEETEITTKDKIIRLKPKAEPIPQVEEEIDNVQDDTFDLSPTLIDDIFSDEESDNENEGRFKSVTVAKRNVSLVPYSQLVGGSTNAPQPVNSNRERRSVKKRSKKRRNRGKSPQEATLHKNASPSKNQRDKSPRSRTPPKVSKASEQPKNGEAKAIRHRVVHRSDRPRVTSPIENKKIEIKIRNPSKYESLSSSSYDVANEDETAKRHERNERKVALALKESERKGVDGDDDDDPSVVIDEEDDPKKTEAGDLRAQLSRKRAERQHNKLPVAEDVNSRLLQNALEGAVFKKAKKKAKRTTESSAAPKEDICVVRSKFTSVTRARMLSGCKRRVHLLFCAGAFLQDEEKLPIHFRLGLSSDTDIFADKKKAKKPRTAAEQV